MNSSHGSDQRGGEASMVGRPPDSLAMANINPQPPPNTTLSMSMPFLSQPTGNLGGGGQGSMATQPPPPPPRCQIINPFLQSPPLASLEARLQHQAAAGSSLPIGQLVQENTGPGVPNAFGQDLRHHRGYPNVILPPAFQVHPNLQSQIQAFQNDMNQHGHMTQPPGFLQGFIPSDVNVAAVVQQQAETNSRTSHLLQPHVRQRVRRRSRANRALQHHAHHHASQQAQQREGPDAEGGGTGLRSRSVSEVPTARISVVEAGGGFGDTNVATGGAAAVRLDDSKLKGLEENYSSIGENFECNICFQKANEAVVTCCGHLFCWPCLYRWLHIHSYHKECPVCKGAIDENSITPIYGRECSALLSARGGLPGGSAADRIPPRPPARRVESARQLREREDRGREREQRERALERERERDEEDARGLSDIQVLGSGTTLQIDEAASITMMRDGIIDQVGQPTASTGGEITSQETSGNSNLEEIDQSEGPAHENSGSGRGGSTPSQTTGRSIVGNNVSSRMQQDLRSGVGNGADNTGPAFLQRRTSDRREQLRAALAASARNGMNSASVTNFTDRVDEHRQMIAAAALLSQEWEDIVNISRMVGPVSPTAWMTAMQRGRLGGMEGTATDNLGGDLTSNSPGGPGGVVIHTPSRPSRPQHHMPQILLPRAMDVGISGSGVGNESSLSRLLTVNPIRSGEWLATMRSRLSSVEKIVENLESTPIQLFQQSSSGVFHVNHLLPAQSSSLHSGPLILETVSSRPVANSEPGPAPARHLVEEICPNIQAPRACAPVILEAPSTTRRLEEQTVTPVVQPQGVSSLPEASAGTSGGVATPQSSHYSRTTTQADLRLHYREAPLSRPSSSRRRSTRVEDLTGLSDGTSTEGSGCTAGTGAAGQETMRSRPKRRRLN